MNGVRYRYRAARTDGTVVRGLMRAATADQVGALLRQAGTQPLSVEVVLDEEVPRTRCSRADLAILFRSLASLVAAGVPVERAVGATTAMMRGPLRVALPDIRRALREGQSLGGALEGVREIIPGLAAGMVRAGERGGGLARALEEVATHFESEAALVGAIRQALAYPLVLTVAGLVSVATIVGVILPRFAQLLQDSGQRLPFTTQLLLSTGSWTARSAPILLPLVATAATAFLLWIRSSAGQLAWHELLLATPVIGAVRRQMATARVCRALSGLVTAGMPMLPALQAAGEAAGDRSVARALALARERVSRGEGLAASLEAEQVVAPLSLQLLSIGEQSGQLARMARHAGDLAAREAERGLHTAVTLLEPGLVVVFGGLVAMVAAALLQAVYSLRPGG